MEYLHNGSTLHCPPGTFPLSTDSMVLSGFIKLPKNARVLDLGAGCGTLGLLLCDAYSDCHVTGIELEPAAHDAALENIRRNGLSQRLVSLCGDLRRLAPALPAGHFDVCVSNPPYFTGGPASVENTRARREDTCSLSELFDAAGRAVRFGGDFYLVHRPERLAQLCACASRVRLEPKRLRLVRHRSDGPISLVLLQCRKGGKPGLIIEEMSLRDAAGDPTEEYRKLYHL